MRRVTLVGYRASGKSTLAARAAARLGWPWRDADVEAERRVGRPIAELFATEGEAVFRALEVRVLRELLAGEEPLVLATGGGCVLAARNRAVLRERGGLVAYLHAPAAVLAERLRRDAGGRPSLTGRDVAEEAAALLARREPLYREVADLVLDATAPVEKLAEDLAAAVVDVENGSMTDGSDDLPRRGGEG